MAKVLYIKANPKDENESLSLTIGRHFINAYKERNQNDEIIEIDVYKDDIPLLDKDVLNSWQKLWRGTKFEELTEIEKEKNCKINQIVEEFISADKYVIASPMWNFSFPPMLKAYIDNIIVTGKTFKYTENGPIGLLKNKKMVHIQASGGIYTDSPFELSDKYLRTVFGFIGIDSIESIFIEGSNMPNIDITNSKENAIKKAGNLALKF